MILSSETSPRAIDHWLQAIAQLCGAFGGQPLGPLFSGAIQSFNSGALNLSLVQARQARLYRTDQEVEQTAERKYFAVFQLEGQAQMQQGSHTAQLSTGDITVIDAARPSQFTYSDHSRQLSLILPHSLMNQSLRFTDVRCGEVIPARSSVAMLTSHLVMDTTRQAGLSFEESEAALEAIVSLLRPAICAKEQGDLHERSFRRAIEFIDQHIRDAELCPDLIGRQVGVSVRGLYRLFAKKGLVVAQYIKHRRLDLCAESIRHADPQQRLSTLSDAWGFTDSSHFSTAFKAKFGVSPREYRKRFH